MSEILTSTNKSILFNRIWAMPDKWTFNIQPIKELIYRYCGDGKGWIDPFAGENSPAEITNDLNPERPTTFHLHAKEFALQLGGDTEEYFSIRHTLYVKQKNVTME